MDDDDSVFFKPKLTQEFVEQEFCCSSACVRELHLASVDLDVVIRSRSQVFDSGSYILSEFFQIYCDHALTPDSRVDETQKSAFESRGA